MLTPWRELRWLEDDSIAERSGDGSRGEAYWSVPGADREHNSKGLPLEIKTVVPGRPASTVLLFMCIIKPAVSRRIQTVARIFTLI